jgi:hypothetical protein
MLNNRQLPAFTGLPGALAAGQKATVTTKLNLGERVHVIWLEFGSDDTNAGNAGRAIGIGTLAQPGMVDEIRLLINGIVVRRMTAVQLDYINKLNASVYGTNPYAAKTYGANAAFRTQLPIFLSEPWRKGFVTLSNGLAVPEAELSAWNLAGIETATMEVDLIGRKAGSNQLTTNTFLTGFYEYDELTSDKIGDIVKWKSYSIGVGASPAEITTLDKKTGKYQSLHLFATTTPNYVTSVMFTRNNKQVRQDISRAQNDAILISRGMSPSQGATAALTPVDTTDANTKQNTGVYNIVFDYDDPVRNLLGVDGANELTLKPTFDATPSAALPVIAQIVGPAIEG